jgi:adenosylcobyric acid synthase
MAQAGEIARVALTASTQALGWQNAQGNVLGLYLHGLFEDPAALQALFGKHLERAVPTLDTVFDGLATFIEQHFEPGVLMGLLTPSKPISTAP